MHAPDGISELADAFFIGAADDEGANAIVEHLLDGHDLTRGVGLAGEDDAEALVQHHFGAAFERFVVDVGMQADPHLAPAGQNVDRAIVVLADDHPVRGRRLGELFDLVTQRCDVVARLAQRVAELFVL